MIGYSEKAKTRYHKSNEYTVPGWAKCRDMLWMAHLHYKEATLRRAAPHLSRCTRCWKGEK